MSDNPTADIEVGSAIPLSKQDDSDIVRACHLMEKEAASRHGEWREESKESFDFLVGHQWSEDDMALLNEQLRPSVVFNMIASFFEVVAGAQINNRQETKYNPTNVEAGGKSEIVGLVADWALERCDAEDEESEAFRNMLTCGMGWTESFMDYLDDAQGKYICENVDPFEMEWDPDAMKRNLADAKWFRRRRWMPEDEVMALWPGTAADLIMSSGGEETGATEPMEPIRDAYTANAEDNTSEAPRHPRGVAVRCFEWREMEPAYTVSNPSGQIETLTQDQWNVLGKRLGPGRDQLRHVKQERRVWYRAHVAANVLLDGPTKAPCPFRSSFCPITGHRDRRNNTFFGILRHCKDPQRWANKWLSQTLDVMNRQPKGGYILEEGAVRDIRRFEADAAKPGSNLVVAAGALQGGRIREKELPQLPQGPFQLLQFAIGTIPAITGINDEMRGQVDKDQSGVVEWHRKQAATAMLAPLFDSLRRYYKERGRLTLYFITHYISPQRAIRIVGPGQQPMMVTTAMIGDPDGYDIEVDEAPTSPNQKTAVWMSLQNLLPSLMQLGLPMPVWLEFLKYSPFPDSVVAKIEQIMQTSPMPPNEHQQKAQSAQMEMQLAQMKQKAQLELEQNKAMHEAALMKQKTDLEMQLQQQRAQTDIAIAAQKAHMQRQISYHDQAMKQEGEKHQHELRASQALVEMQPYLKANENVGEAVQQAMQPVMAHIAKLHGGLSDLHTLMKAPRRVVRDKRGRVQQVEPITPMKGK